MGMVADPAEVHAQSVGMVAGTPWVSGMYRSGLSTFTSFGKLTSYQQRRPEKGNKKKREGKCAIGDEMTPICVVQGGVSNCMQSKFDQSVQLCPTKLWSA